MLMILNATGSEETYLQNWRVRVEIGAMEQILSFPVQTGSVYEVQNYFSMLLPMETFPQSSWTSLPNRYIIFFGLLSKTAILVF